MFERRSILSEFSSMFCYSSTRCLPCGGVCGDLKCLPGQDNTTAWESLLGVMFLLRGSFSPPPFPLLSFTLPLPEFPSPSCFTRFMMPSQPRPQSCYSALNSLPKASLQLIKTFVLPFGPQAMICNAYSVINVYPCGWSLKNSSHG